jgi:ATP-dependent helicase/nuclease subunit A
MIEKQLAVIASAETFDFTGLDHNDGWTGQGLSLRTEQVADSDKLDNREAVEQEYDPLPDWAVAPVESVRSPSPMAPSSGASEPGASDDAPVMSPLADDGGARFRRGLVIHRLLELLPELPVAERAAAAMRFADTNAAEFGPTARRDIVERVMAVLEEPAFAPIFGPNSRAEVALAGRLGGRAVSGRVDRLCVADGAVLIVDYKSQRSAPAGPNAIPAAYLRQMAVYRALAREIFPDRTVRCALLWTSEPRLTPLSDTLMDAAIANIPGVT